MWIAGRGYVKFYVSCIITQNHSKILRPRIRTLAVACYRLLYSEGAKSQAHFQIWYQVLAAVFLVLEYKENRMTSMTPLCEGKKSGVPPILSTKYNTRSAMSPSTSMTACIPVNILLNRPSSHSFGCFCC